MFTFGNAHFHGSTGNKHVSAPVVGIAGDSTGGGYWLATQDGSVYNFGDAKKEGGAKRTLSSMPPDHPDHERSRQRRLPAARAAGADRSSSRRSAWARRAPRSSACSSGSCRSDTGCPGVTGVFDSLTQQAVWAFQKYENLPRTGVVDDATHKRMHSAVRPVPRSTSGYAIEVDKTRQVLIVANGGHAEWVFNVSSGSDHPYTLDGVGYSAHTPGGHLQRHPGRRRVRQEPARRALPAAVLHQHRHRGARLHRRAAVPGIARLRAGLRRRDRLHLGQQHHAHRRHGLGVRLTGRRTPGAGLAGHDQADDDLKGCRGPLHSRSFRSLPRPG